VLCVGGDDADHGHVSVEAADDRREKPWVPANHLARPEKDRGLVLELSGHAGPDTPARFRNGHACGQERLNDCPGPLAAGEDIRIRCCPRRLFRPDCRHRRPRQCHPSRQHQARKSKRMAFCRIHSLCGVNTPLPPGTSVLTGWAGPGPGGRVPSAGATWNGRRGPWRTAPSALASAPAGSPGWPAT